MERKTPLLNGEIYHIFNRSIADYKIFNNSKDFERMLKLIRFFRLADPPEKFSRFINAQNVQKIGFWDSLESLDEKHANVQLLAYCLMPTHVHLVLKQTKDHGISVYVGNILNSYTKYFNVLHNRRGPLWESKFQNVLVRDDEQLLHLTRYLHLNPVTAKLVKKPEEWKYSSYLEYTGQAVHRLCEYQNILQIDSNYKKFVNDRIAYQRELALIKKILIET